MLKKTLKSIAIILLTISSLTAHAKQSTEGKEVYSFDKSHTNILWLISHMGFSDSIGQFMDYDGQIILDLLNPDQSAVNITIKTASIMTGLKDFDKHLKSSDFFNVEKFPTATFTSKKITLGNENRAKVEGEFTMLGVTKPLTLYVRLNKRAPDIQANKMRAGFTVKATIKRSLWGMEKYLPLIGDDVKIRIEAEAMVSQ